MAHQKKELDKIATYKPAWHGLSTVFDRPMTRDEVRVNTSICDYTVKQTPSYVFYNKETGDAWFPTDEELQQGLLPPAGYVPLRTESMFNIRHDLKLPDNRAILSPTGVGKGYEVVQNVELLDIADAMVDESGTQYESGGTLRNGKIVWILAKFPQADSIEGDKVDRFILLYSSHDGSRRITVASTRIRVVCWNTLSAAIDGNEGIGFDNKVELRHTASVKDRIAEAVRAVKLAKDAFDKEREIFTSLAKKAIDRRFIDAYTWAICPNPAGGRTSQAEAKRAKIVDLLDRSQAGFNGPGMRIDGKPTAYALLNAVTEQQQHFGVTRTREGKNASEEKFFNNMMGGTSERNRSIALSTLLRGDELVEAAEKNKRELLAVN